MIVWTHSGPLEASGAMRGIAGPDNGVLARAFLAGVATGLRSQATLPVLARAVREGRFDVGATAPYSWLRSETVGWLAALAAAGEMVIDKLPFTSARIEPGPLAGRLAFGALAGSVIASAGGCPLLSGVLTGAAGALGGSFAGYWARSRAVESMGLADPAVALCEDAIAISLARTIAS